MTGFEYSVSVLIAGALLSLSYTGLRLAWRSFSRLWEIWTAPKGGDQ